MPNNKKKGRSAKKGAKDDRKAEKEQKKFEARLIYEPCPNGLRCSDPKCLYVHACPVALEEIARCLFFRSISAEEIETAYPNGIDMEAPPLRVAQTIAFSKNRIIRGMIQNHGFDFRFGICSYQKCDRFIRLHGASKGNGDLRTEIDVLFCAQCDQTFCMYCLRTCQGCHAQFCSECDPLLYVGPTKLQETINLPPVAFFSTHDNYCYGCNESMFPDTVGAFDDAKYRAVMCHLYSKFPSCAYCATHLPNGPETKRCGGCFAVRYCGKECQENDWSGKHREYCQVLRQDRNDRLAKWYQKHQPKLEAEAGLWDIE